MNRYLFILLMSVILWPLSILADEKDEEPKLTSFSIAEDSVLTGFSIGDSITFTTSFDSISGGFREYIIEKGSNKIVYDAFNSVKNEKGEWVLKFYENVVFQEKKSYSLVIEGHEVIDSKSKVTGNVTVILVDNGDTPEPPPGPDTYTYSDAKYLFFSTEEGGEISSLRLNFITVQFTKDVIIDAERSRIVDEDGKEYPFNNIITINDKESEWSLYIPLDLLLRTTDHVTFRFYAKGKEDGRQVKGNQGRGEDSYYELNCKCHLGYPVLSVLPEEGSYDTLKDFTFSNDDGIEIMNPENEIVLLSSDGKTAASFKAKAWVAGTDNLSYTYSLEQPIDVIGYYTLVVPEGTFSIGTKKLGNKETSMAYEVNSKLKMYGLKSIDPADGSEVESLSQFILNFEDRAMPEYFVMDKISVTNESDSVITYGKATIDSSREDYGQCIIILDKPVVDPGFYHLNIPEKTFSIGFWGENSSQAMTFDYTVFGPPDPVYNVEVEYIADADNQLERLELVFPEFGIVDMADSRTIYYRDVAITDTLDNVVAQGKLKIGMHQNQLYVEEIQVVESLQGELGEKLGEGMYRLHIPENILIFDWNSYDQEFVLDLNFDLAYNVNVQVSPNANDITKLEKVTLDFSSFSEVDLAPNGKVGYQDVTVTDSENNVLATARISKSGKQNQLIVDNILNDQKEKLSFGDYWLHVPADIMIFDEKTYGKEYVLKFNFPVPDAFKQVNAFKNNGRVRVYSAQGMLTRDEKDPEKALRGLRRGLYIINGQKVLIK